MKISFNFVIYKKCFIGGKVALHQTVFRPIRYFNFTLNNEKTLKNKYEMLNKKKVKSIRIKDRSKILWIDPHSSIWIDVIFITKLPPDLLDPPLPRLSLLDHPSTSNLTPRHTPSNSSTPPISPPISPQPHQLDQPPLFGSSARPLTSSAKGRGFLCGVKPRDEVRRMEPPRRSGVEGKKRRSREDLLLVCKKKKNLDGS